MWHRENEGPAQRRARSHVFWRRCCGKERHASTTPPEAFSSGAMVNVSLLLTLFIFINADHEGVHGRFTECVTLGWCCAWHDYQIWRGRFSSILMWPDVWFSSAASGVPGCKNCISICIILPWGAVYRTRIHRCGSQAMVVCRSVVWSVFSPFCMKPVFLVIS